MAKDFTSDISNGELSGLFANRCATLLETTDKLKGLLEKNKAMNFADAYANHQNVNDAEKKYLGERDGLLKEIGDVLEKLQSIAQTQARLAK